MKRDWIQCDKCCGHGEIPLPDCLRETLEAVKAGYETAESICAIQTHAPLIGISAINNRLVKLETFGYIQRIKKGKEFFWSIKSRSPKKLAALAASRKLRWKK